MKWWDESWNITTGCTHLSEACLNCYAAREASTRLAKHPKYQGLTENSKWTGEVRTWPDLLEKPLRWRKPRRIFVCNMSDLFHPDVPFEFIDKALSIMALAQQHVFIICTKRHNRMHQYFTQDTRHLQIRLAMSGLPKYAPVYTKYPEQFDLVARGLLTWPLPNVWLGVTTENQAHAEERISTLIHTPATVRFVSIEPMLQLIDLPYAYFVGVRKDPFWAYDPSQWLYSLGDKLDWAIVGGESGPNPRPFDAEWARSIRNQCKEAGIAFYMKQMSGREPIPQDLQIQEYPSG